MKKLIIVGAMLMNTGMTTWAMSWGMPVENLQTDTRITVASPLAEVEEAATKVNTGVTTTPHIAIHMGYERLLNILKVYFPWRRGSSFVFEKFSR